MGEWEGVNYKLAVNFSIHFRHSLLSGLLLLSLSLLSFNW